LNAAHNHGGLRWVRTAISKRTGRRLQNGAFILLIFYGVFKWPDRPTIEEVKGDFDCVGEFVAWKLSTGPAGRNSEAEDTNSH
jgi:hypothetical protein